MGGPRPDAGDAFALAESLAEEWEQTFSRFRNDSELCRLNTVGDRPVSARLFSAIQHAIEAARLSRGAFNPLVLPALVAAGYDRSFEHVRSRHLQHGQGNSAPSPDQIILDMERHWVRLPEGGRLDLGGIAKGLYADELAHQLSDWPGGIVSAGGDMRLWGEGPDDGAWAVGVEPPDRGELDLAVVLMSDGGISTSGVNRRFWEHGGTNMHHLIDPRTGLPAVGELTAVTAIASTAALAEAAATSLFINPGLAEDSVLARKIWGVITSDSQGQATYTRFNSEGPFRVYLTS